MLGSGVHPVSRILEGLSLHSRGGSPLALLKGNGGNMGAVIIENVRGQWVVDRTTTGVFQEENTGYGDGALIELEIVKSRSLCCHPDNPVMCTHDKS